MFEKSLDRKSANPKMNVHETNEYMAKRPIFIIILNATTAIEAKML